MHIDFALPVDHDLLAGFKEWKKKAKVACADYGFHMAVTSWSAKVAADMAKLVKEGINSFKFFMAYKVCGTSFGSVCEAAVSSCQASSKGVNPPAVVLQIAVFAYTGASKVLMGARHQAALNHRRVCCALSSQSSRVC